MATIPDLSERQRAILWSRVLPAMDAWEREHRSGSARPAFERFWRDACAAERVHPLTTFPRTADRPSGFEREWCWQHWLQAGRPLTPEAWDAQIQQTAADHQIAPATLDGMLRRGGVQKPKP